MLKTKRARMTLIAACAVLLVAAVVWRSAFHATKAADPAKSGAPSVPVVTTAVKEQDVPTYLAGIGTVT